MSESEVRKGSEVIKCSEMATEIRLKTLLLPDYAVLSEIKQRLRNSIVVPEKKWLELDKQNTQNKSTMLAYIEKSNQLETKLKAIQKLLERKAINCNNCPYSKICDENCNALNKFEELRKAMEDE